MRRQVTDSRMQGQFEKIFGSPDKVVVDIGDFEQKQHRKFKESSHLL